MKPSKLIQVISVSYNYTITTLRIQVNLSSGYVLSIFCLRNKQVQKGPGWFLDEKLQARVGLRIYRDLECQHR